MSCEVCKEKQSEINRILKAYQKDKKFYRYTALGEGIIIIMFLAFGTHGIQMLFDAVIKIIGR